MQSVSIETINILSKRIKMKIQLALDVFNDKEIFDVLRNVHDVIDIAEIGTPMIIRYGVGLVTEVKNAYPSLAVLADTKIMDAGRFEADYGFDAGADIVTVMGVAHVSTIEGVVESARNHGGQSMVDMMNVPDLIESAKLFDRIGVDYICIHNATDALDMDATLERLAVLYDVVPREKIVMAGGINPTNIGKIEVYDPAVAVVGNYVVTSPDMRQAILTLRDARKEVAV